MEEMERAPETAEEAGTEELRQRLEEEPGREEAPEEARRIAAEKETPLLDGHLRFRHEERRRVQEEEARAHRAAEQSTGSLFSAAVRPQPEQEAFTRAFRRALGR